MLHTSWLIEKNSEQANKIVLRRESSEEKNVQLSEVVTSTRELLLYTETKDVILNLLNGGGDTNNSVYVFITC